MFLHPFRSPPSPLPFILWEQGRGSSGRTGLDGGFSAILSRPGAVRCWSGHPGLLPGTHQGAPREFLEACAKLSRPLQRLLLGLLPPPLWVTRKPRRRKEVGLSVSLAYCRRLDLPPLTQLLYFEFHQQKNRGNFLLCRHNIDLLLGPQS